MLVEAVTDVVDNAAVVLLALDVLAATDPTLSVTDEAARVVEVDRSLVADASVADAAADKAIV